MVILSKACKPDNFESHNSLKLSFTNIRSLRLNFNSLPIECFPLTYDLSGFKSRINRYLLTVGSF